MNCCHNDMSSNKDMEGHEHHEGHDMHGSDEHAGHAENAMHAMHAGPEAAKDFLKRFFIVTFLLIPLLLLTETALRILGLEDFTARKYLQFGVATVIFYFAFVFFEHARHEWMAKSYGMMTLVSIAVGAGYLFSAASTFIPALDVEFYIEISTLIWVLLFGHYLEAKSSVGAGDALKEVAQLLPRTAHKKEGEKTVDIDVTELKIGDIILIKPGEKVPADGEIIEGSSNFNEALITGESKPVEKGIGKKVIAGAINIDGSVEVRITEVGANSTVGQIKKLIAEAQMTKPSAQKLADRASKWLTIIAVVTALITIIIWSLIVGESFVFSISLAITVLVIACPHALGLAIPTVSTIATSLAVKNGLFIKDLGKLEVIKDIDYIILDKTGTLTKGAPEVTDFAVMSDLAESGLLDPGKSAKSADYEKHVLALALSVEEKSEHPLAKAIVEFAKKQDLPKVKGTGFKTATGKGVEALFEGKKVLIGNKNYMQENGVMKCAELDELAEKLLAEAKTVLYLSYDGKNVAIFAIADALKETAREAVEKLHSLGVKTAIVTGDNKQTADAVAKILGIDRVFADVLPEEKYKYVKKLQDEGERVMMVGDGINDAPALTQADAGVAIGAGTEVAVEAGDIVLTKSDPLDLPKLIILSRKVYRKMLENLFWALGYNVVAIPAAAGIFAPFGFFLPPGVGAFLMSLSSVIVVANALTLRKTKLT